MAKTSKKKTDTNGATLGFEAKHAELLTEYPEGAEDPDEYRAENIFWVPKGARWSHLQDTAKQPGIGQRIDEAMLAIEAENPSLKGVLPKEYARPQLSATMLGELIDLISGIALGEERGQARDILGRVYEYFLGAFASNEGKRGGEFYTPRSVVRVLVEMLEPFPNPKLGIQGRVYDPWLAAPGACSCRPNASSAPTAGASATSPSMGRNPTTPPGGCAR